jgi:uncharacterized protein
MGENAKAIEAVFVCGGDFHDFDFARLEILKLLGEHPEVRVKVACDYGDVASIAGAAILISYTCSLMPTDDQIEQGLKPFFAKGGRWFALHATNSITKWVSGPNEPPRVATPAIPDTLFQMLGSQFKAHPPLIPFEVTVCPEAHPYAEGIAGFTVEDEELYLSDYAPGNAPILETSFRGKVPHFEDGDWERDVRHLVAYHRTHDAGETLYYTLGHARGHWDFRPMMDYYPKIERGAWAHEAHYTLLRRGIAWAKTGQFAAVETAAA